jgi:hypothetical protein
MNKCQTVESDIADVKGPPRVADLEFSKILMG